MKNTALVLVLFLISFPVFANGILKGHLVDAATSEPLHGASVTLKNEKNKLAFTLVSGLDGSFLLKSLPD